MQITDIGQRDHLSTNDIKKLLITYKCNGTIEPISKNKTKDVTKNRNKILKENKGKEREKSTKDTYLKDSINDDFGRYNSFNTDENLESWSFLDYFDYPKFYISPFYVDYLYYIG